MTEAEARMVLWSDVRRGDYIRDASGMVWQCFEFSRGTARIYNPERGMHVGHPNPNAAIEMVQRGETGTAVDTLRAAGFAVDIIKEDPINRPDERPTHHEHA